MKPRKPLRIRLARFRARVSRSEKLTLMLLRFYVPFRMCRIQQKAGKIRISKDNRSILIADRHAPYTIDLIDNFDFYFNSTKSDVDQGVPRLDVDFSEPKRHLVRGFEDFRVWVPSIVEPIETLQQYCEVSRIEAGWRVIDLGAYSAVSSMWFSDVVGPEGLVVAVEADPETFVYAQKNVEEYFSLRGFGPNLMNVACWSTDGEIEFVSEGNLGSGARDVLSRNVNSAVTVRSLTLSSIASEWNLDRVDLLKADIEGAEYFAFSDEAFFARYSPIIVFEPAQSSAEETHLSSLRCQLEGYGYSLVEHQQVGSRLPLVVAARTPREPFARF